VEVDKNVFVVANLIAAIAEVLDIVLSIYMWAIIIRAVISWVNPDPYNPIVRFLYHFTEPALRPVRRVLPFSGFGIDISPIVVILGIVFLRRALVATLFELAARLG